VIDGTDLTDARKCLKVVKSPQIRGLGYPGASGLLALIFKEWFGTIEHRPLCGVELLPEKQDDQRHRCLVKQKGRMEREGRRVPYRHYEKESSPT
jgi:hypothetical protein